MSMAPELRPRGGALQLRLQLRLLRPTTAPRLEREGERNEEVRGDEGRRRMRARLRLLLLRRDRVRILRAQQRARLLCGDVQPRRRRRPVGLGEPLLLRERRRVVREEQPALDRLRSRRLLRRHVDALHAGLAPAIGATAEEAPLLELADIPNDRAHAVAVGAVAHLEAVGPRPLLSLRPRFALGHGLLPAAVHTF